MTVGTTWEPRSLWLYLRGRDISRDAPRLHISMHAVLDNFVLIDDRYRYETGQAKLSTTEAYHGYHAVELFSDALTKENYIEEENDALWATPAGQVRYHPVALKQLQHTNPGRFAVPAQNT
ncbi:hypothetical protein CERZMDRAFT_97194 [Cercospora zeae-maydis SCOH1-5]|uniref:Uncharacterized protein n=1 Tax=Cercospora zeae-maydis SCOH1-5 TaxID=717836 RepID=A0A6A6FGW0_9PEZI|nr:hypothetical protein CERZMDRAFT_97194 [Cercospora zeae-maydis SCOH1-5]